MRLFLNCSSKGYQMAGVCQGQAELVAHDPSDTLFELILFLSTAYAWTMRLAETDGAILNSCV